MRFAHFNKALVGVLGVLALLVGACSTSPTARPAAESTTSTTTVVSTAPPDLTIQPPQGSDLVEPALAMAGVDGFLAVTTNDGLNIVAPTGEIVAQFGDGMIVTQPTWSRDATRLVATFFDPGTGQTEVGVIDTDTWTLATQPAARPYFFYTWNDETSLLAALGPGNGGGTSVDILDATGVPAANAPLPGGSMYVAWEPGGTDLLLHANGQMLLVDDLDAVEDSRQLGAPGANFQAPSWIPGTRDYLYIDSTIGEGRLIRENVDTGESTDLGDAAGFVTFSVHPDGAVAAMSSASNEPPVTFVSTAFVQERTTPIVELVDLNTGERTMVIDAVALWLEWSPDGEKLLIASVDPAGLTWNVWTDTGLTTMGSFQPAPGFLGSYVRFADQYVEMPRLWSPNSSAFTFAAVVDGATSAVAIRVSDGASTVLATGDVSFWSSVVAPA